MSKQCAKCSKTVYPTEELKCLDKVWHKFCFKCTTCGMTLNLKNFQGFDRLPYCRAHTPKAKHTNVADTPEISRVKEATKNQSLAAYHENFEKGIKGRCTQIADDPETLRLLKNQNTFSNVKYQEDYIKSKAGKAPVEDGDGPDQRFISQVEQNQGYRNKPGSINDYDPLNDQYGSLVAQGQQPPQQQQPYSSYSGQQWQETVPVARVQQPESHASSIESNPPQNRKGSLPAGAVPVIGMAPLSPVGKTADEKAGKREEGSPDTAKDKQATKEIEKDKLPTKDESQKPKEQPPPVSQPPPAPPSSSSAVYKAMYDYDAADDDEVSFRDGDIIINTEPIDDGWMYGTVQRSGQTGMLPSNYVERIQ